METHLDLSRVGVCYRIINVLLFRWGKMISFEEAQARLESVGQSHVLQFWAELSEDERTALLEEISQLEPKELLEHCRAAVAAASRHSTADVRLDARMEPVAPEFIGSVRKSDKETLQMWNDEGKPATNDFCTLSESKNYFYFIFRVVADFTEPGGCFAVSWWSGDETWGVISQRNVQCWAS